MKKLNQINNKLKKLNQSEAISAIEIMGKYGEQLAELCQRVETDDDIQDLIENIDTTLYWIKDSYDKVQSELIEEEKENINQV